MPKSLRYYISLPKASTNYQRLQTLESTFGSFFQKMPEQELKDLLCYCVTIYAGDNASEMYHAYLTEQTRCFQYFDKSLLFNFVPFLYSVIQERENAN
jgi:hypothetical protein